MKHKVQLINQSFSQWSSHLVILPVKKTYNFEQIKFYQARILEQSDKQISTWIDQHISFSNPNLSSKANRWMELD